MKEQTTLDGSLFKTPTSDDWETPPKLFQELDKEFHFTLDPCCLPETAKCDKYYTPDENGLRKSWQGERVFMNPPYSDLIEWTKKAYIEVLRLKRCPLIVALLPAWTDRGWFHDFIYPSHAEIRFLPSRVKFLRNGIEEKSPSFGSMVIIWRSSE